MTLPKNPDRSPGQFGRRDFLKGSAAGLAVLGLPTALGGAALEKLMPGSPYTKYFQRFGIDENLVRKVLMEALARGGEYCDLYFQHTLRNTIMLQDRTVNQAYSRIELGVGIRVVKGDQIGFSHTQDLSEKAMFQAARTAAAIASGTPGKGPKGFALQPISEFYPLAEAWELVKADRKVPLLQKLDDRMRALESRIVSSSVYYNDEDSHVLIATSDGRITYDYRPMCSLSGSCVVEQKGQKEEGWFSLSMRDGMNYFTPERLERIAKQATSRAVQGFEAVKPEGGEMEVVLAPGGAGILLHEAIGHGLEADFNRKKISIFSDKIGKTVAEKFVTVVDDGTVKNWRGTINVDDEGTPSQRTVLVENGVLVGYLHDRISAAHYKVAPTGNGRRQSFKHPPIPRMRNTFMEPGPHSKDEIIKSVKKGIYAEEFTNGQVQIGAGDFTFYVKSGFLIENGRLTRPIKDVNIIGNGPEVLRRVTMVGKDLELSESTWTCGKNGQGVPASQGLPTVKVSAITVGGVQA